MERGKPLTAIYTLSGDDGGVRYVGKANDPEKRFKQHMRESSRRHTPLYAWIRKCKKAGAPITLRVIEWCPRDKWEEVETREIAKHRLSGRLLNLADGGNAPKNSYEMGGDRAKIAHYKRALAGALRANFLSQEDKEGLRAKMRFLAANNPAVFGKWAAL